MHRPGRHFLQIPGPTNVPDRVLRAIDAPTIDHRGPTFAELGLEVLEGMRWVFGTEGPVVIYPASGTGAWEAAIVNTLSPGDKVIASETGHFATLWREMAERLGLEVVWLEGDWRHGADPERIAAALDDDVKAVMVVHNETSTGVTSRIADVRAALGDHPALLLVDTISSLGQHRLPPRRVGRGRDRRRARRRGSCSRPGLSFNAVSEKALAASRDARMPRSYWDWKPIIAANEAGFWPYTSATNLLYGLREALAMLREEGLPDVFARHARHAEATRAAVRGWGLEVLAVDEREFSGALTAVLLDGSDEVRRVILERYDMSLGAGLGKLKDKIFRIGHLGDFNDLMLAGTLSGVQMGLQVAGHDVGDGLSAALEVLKT